MDDLIAATGGRSRFAGLLLEIRSHTVYEQK